MNRKVILAFGLKKEQEQGLVRVCKSAGAALKKISAAETQKTLGYLAGIQGIPAYAGGRKETVSENCEMLVFSGFSQEELYEFLAECRQTGTLLPVLKAMITMHNIFWTPGMLYGELAQEHEEMTGGKSN